MKRRQPSARLTLESLEARATPANLSVTGMALVDDQGQMLSSVAVGERVNVAVNFNYDGSGGGHPGFASTVKLGDVVKGRIVPSGSVAGGQFILSDFVIKPGVNTFKASLDSGNKIAESNELDNVKSLSVTAVTFKSAFTGETRFSTPLDGKANVNWYVTNYVDLDSHTGTMMDYAGNTGGSAVTYDGHNGMDLAGANGFATQHNGLPVMAAAGGVVINVADGHFDENTEALGEDADGGYWGNFVSVSHGNGWVTNYIHLRKNSVTVKVGDYVSAGDVLGLMGSSGNSTGTHLHFMATYMGNLIEPYVAPNTYWVNPLPYAGSVSVNEQTYADYHITENSGYAKFKVHRGLADSDTWHFETQDFTATAGSDYASTAGTVHFGFGSYDAWVEVPITADNLREGNEMFGVYIHPEGSGSSSFQIWTIVDDEHALNFDQNAGTLTIDAGTTDLNDVVTIDVKGTNLEVTTNNQPQLFPLNGPLGQVQSIVVNTGAGDDHITILNRPTGVNLTINAGDDADVINLNASTAGKSVVLVGGAGDDTFNIGKPKPNFLTMSLSNIFGDISVNGGGGDNVLNVRGNADGDPGRKYTVASSTMSWVTAEVTYGSIGAINLSAGNGSDTFTVNTGDVAKKIAIDAGGGSDTLVGPSLLGNLWSITAKNAGTINLGAITFTGAENLTGGSKDDTFKFKAGASLTGNLAGGGGNDGLSYGGLAGPIIVNLQTGGATLVGGKFSEIEVFNGSASGADQFTGPNGANLWHMGGNNGLTLNGATTVWNFENLTGGSGDDTFAFTENGFVSGKVDGQGGNDTLDYSARSSPVAIDLAAKTATATGGIASIESVIGGTGADTLAGNGAAAGISLWNITGLNSGTFAGPSTNVAFVGFENLKGYSNTDWFVFANAAKVTGKIDGQGGSDWLNLSAYLTPVTVNLGTSSATGAGTFAGLEYFVGGSSFDTLIGPDTVNTWKITSKNAGVLNSTFNFSSFESLAGGTAADSFAFASGAALDGSIFAGGGSNNALDYSAYTTPVIVNLANGQATGVAGGVMGINDVIGGSGNDTITGDARTNFLKGSGGNDQIDGGEGDDLILGGAGNDTSLGGGGRDLMIGGAGLDILSGGDGDDILIGGSTKHDDKTNVLLAMLNLWKQPEFDYGVRVELLKNSGVMGGLYKLDTPSMLNDGLKDTLNGLADSDWFWVLGPVTTADQTDRTPVELVN